MEQQLKQQEEILKTIQEFENERYTPTNHSDAPKTIQNDSVSSPVSSDKVNNKPYK